MIFYAFLVLVALVAIVWAIRSPMIRQIRRGHGTGRQPFSSSNDDAFNRKQKVVDPMEKLRPREWE
jgi:hypothetical protein